MTNVDNFWLCMEEPTNLMTISALMEFERPLDLERLYGTLKTRLLCFDRFQKRVVRPTSGVGLPDWETDRNFDLRSHVQRTALPAPGDKQALKEMIGDLMSTPLDPTKPLWQFHLIENYGHGCALFIRVHHCIADGIALIHVLLSLTDKKSDTPIGKSALGKKIKAASLEKLFPILSAIKGIQNTAAKTHKIGKTVIDEAIASVSNPSRLVKLAKSAVHITMDAATVLSKLTIMPSDPDTALKGRLGVRKSAAWTEPMPLDVIKTIGRKIGGATINDVLIATLAGGLRRYLKKRNSRVNELDLRMTVPVNIRKPGTEIELGNKFSTVFLALPIYIEDPVLRLKEVKRRMDHLKKAPDAMVGFGVLNALGMLPPDIAKKAAHLFGNKSSAVLTNVPGPKQPLYFAGSEITTLMFWVPRTGKIGTGISIISYAGTVTLGVATDENLLPDPEVLLNDFKEELEDVHKLVKSGRLYEEPLVLYDRYQEAARCRGLTKRGEQCKNRAVPESQYCRIHQSRKNLKSKAEESIRADHLKSAFRCKGRTKTGKPCRNRPPAGSDYCRIHQA
jgi:diacylglycerol O-acyltransferase / wax synthase